MILYNQVVIKEFIYLFIYLINYLYIFSNLVHVHNSTVHADDVSTFWLVAMLFSSHAVPEIYMVVYEF